MTDRATNPDALSALIADIENEIEVLSDRAVACKKAMSASKFVLSAGAALSVALVVGAVRFQPILMMLGIAGFIGGIVGFGSNRGTLIETQARIKVLGVRRLELIDILGLRVIEN